MEVLHSTIQGEGPPLLILHGFLGMSDNWKSLGRSYADAGREVHLIDLRNHGRSFWSDAFSYELMAQDLQRYMDTHQIVNAAVLGHSMGGKVAMTFAAAFPQRVSRLIVADIAPRYYPPHHGHILDALQSLPLDRIGTRGEADEQLALRLGDWGIRQFLLKNLYWVHSGRLGFRFNLPVLAGSMEKIGAALPEAARYEGPVLFIRGGASDYVRDSDMEGIRHHFPKAELQTIPGAGHWLHAEQPEDFFRRSLDFIKS